ncbi:MAG: hypothetical protein ACMXYG_07770 [Candidatus Woesearchaeota archaeon]
MNKKLLVITGVIILISILILFLYLSNKDSYEPEITLSFEDSIRTELANEAYMTCERLRANGDREKCEEIYNNPIFSNYTNGINVESEIKECVIQSAYIKAIKSGNTDNCKAIKELDEYDDDELETKYIQGCKDAILITSVKNEKDCVGLAIEKDNIYNICLEYIKFREDPSIIHTEEVEFLKNIDGLGALVLWTAYTTNNIEFCNLIDPTKYKWYAYKTCVYEVLDGNVEDNFCADYPEISVYTNFII